MSRFDPLLFKQQTFNAQNSTKATPIPAGEYTGVIVKSDIAAWQGKEDTTKSGLKWAGMIQLNDPDGAIKAITEREKNQVRYEFILDLTEEGGLDFGKNANLRLGRLQAATDVGAGGKPWSFEDFMGRELRVFVKHRVTDAGDPVAEVEAVAHM